MEHQDSISGFQSKAEQAKSEKSRSAGSPGPQATWGWVRRLRKEAKEGRQKATGMLANGTVQRFKKELRGDMEGGPGLCWSSEL